jgi:hypothetical protein
MTTRLPRSSPMTTDDTLSVAEAALVLGCKPATVYAL